MERRELASRVRCSDSHLAAVEASRVPPSEDLAVALDTALGADGRLVAMLGRLRDEADGEPIGQFGTALRRCRHTARSVPMLLGPLARAVGVARAHLRCVETTELIPDPDLVARLDEVLATGGALIALDARLSSPGGPWHATRHPGDQDDDGSAGALIRRLRNHRRLSQAALAARAGTGRHTIARIESGRRPLRPKLAARVDDALAADGAIIERAEPAATDTDEDPTTTGAIVRQSRTRLGMTQQQLAEASGCTFSRLGNARSSDRRAGE